MELLLCVQRKFDLRYILSLELFLNFDLHYVQSMELFLCVQRIFLSTLYTVYGTLFMRAT